MLSPVLVFIYILAKKTADKGAQSHEPPKAALWGLASTYGAAIRVCGVENPQGFGIDERRLFTYPYSLTSSHQDCNSHNENQHEHRHDYCLNQPVHHIHAGSQVF